MLPVLIDYVPSIHSLVEQAEQLFHGASDNTKGEMANALLPDQEQWSTAIDPFVDLYPAQSLAITNELGGAVFLIDHQSGSESRSTLHLLCPSYGVVYHEAIACSGFVRKTFRTSLGYYYSKHGSFCPSCD